MTTYTLSGYVRSEPPGSSTELIEPSTVEVIVPDAIDAIIFDPDGTGSEGLLLHDIDFAGPGVGVLDEPTRFILDGAVVQDDDYELLYIEVLSGPYVGLFGVSFYFPGPDIDAIFQIGGADRGFGTLANARAFEAYFDSVPDSEALNVFSLVPGGAFASGTQIPLTSLTGINVTQDDHIEGTEAADQLEGGKGADTLAGGAGDDVLAGDAGGDDLSGGQGADSLQGGAGGDDISGGAGGDAISGGAGSDDINGGAGADDLNGGGGGDDLKGGAGRDTIKGGGGKDDLAGGGGADDLKGGAGADVLAGGGGADTLTGNAGKDSFVFAKNAGRDTVTDFMNNRDTLVLNDNLWNPTLSVSQVLDRFAQEVAGDVVFAFGNRGTLTVEGITIQALENDIDVI